MSGKISSLEERRKQKKGSKQIKNKKKVKFAIILVLIGYFVIRAIPMALSSYIKTEPVEKEMFTDKIKTEGVLLKNETVYSDSSENLEFTKSEGERIGSGETIAVSKSSNYDSLEKEIQSADESIALYTELQNEYNWLKGLEQKDEQAVEGYINYLGEKTELSQEKLDSIRNDLERGTKTNESFFKDKLEELSASKAKAEKSLKTGKETYIAKAPGVISSRVDGLEKQLSPSTLEKLDFSKYNEIKTKVKSVDKESVAKGVKIVEGHIWYLAMELDKVYENEFKDKKNIEVEFQDGEFAISGKVHKLETKEKVLLVLEFNEGLHRVYDQRDVKVSLVKGRYSGLKVPSSSLIEKNGQRGVYIKEISGIVKFIPIRLLYKGDEYSIVNEEEEGTIEYERDGEVLTVRSLQVFDEVFKNSMMVRENQVIN